MFIYKATNKENGKCYIGKTRNFKKRISQHKRKYKNTDTYFYNSIRKYGWDVFIWAIIEDCISEENIDDMEFHYIKQYKSIWNENGYNMTYGGEGQSNMSDIVKEKISNTLKGRKLPEDTKRNMRKSHNHLPRHKGSKSPLAKKYVITTPENKSFVVQGIREFCRKWEKENLYHISLCYCANGKQKQSKGYKCRYYNEVEDFDLPHFEIVN